MREIIISLCFSLIASGIIYFLLNRQIQGLNTKINNLNITLKQIYQNLQYQPNLQNTPFKENTENNENTETTENTENTEKIILPKYISLKKINIKNSNEIKYCLVYDKKTENNRYTFKLLCNKNISINDNLKIFINKINEKFS